MSDAGANVVALALDPSVEPPDDPASRRILDAALALAAASGLRHLTMDEIARRAGVGRMTVYRRFDDKQRLVEALAVREARACLAALDAAVDLDAPIADQLSQGFVTTLRIAREHPLLNRLARIEPEQVLASLTADDNALVTLACAFLAARLKAARDGGLITLEAVDEAAELLVRLGFSFVLLQETLFPLDDEARLRELASALIAPIIAAPPPSPSPSPSPAPQPPRPARGQRLTAA